MSKKIETTKMLDNEFIFYIICIAGVASLGMSAVIFEQVTIKIIESIILLLVGIALLFFAIFKTKQGSESLHELRSVQWPTKNYAVRVSTITVIFVVLSTFFIGFLDIFLNWIML